MPTEPQRVQQYFERVPVAFDHIYDPVPPGWRGWLPRWRHRSMFERFRLTLELCADVTGKRVLDLGCGSGRYSIALAQRGATVVGVDFSQAMVELAMHTAQAAGVSARCQFVQGDLLRVPLAGPFDVALAIGLFDYVRDPGPMLERIRQVRAHRLLASFPVRDHLLTPVRTLRLALANCPVYFYTAAGVRAWCQPGAEDVIIRSLGRDYLAMVTYDRQRTGAR